MTTRSFFESLDSTQVRALMLAREGAAPGTRIVAGFQTEGRGRGDHTWASPPGGLYLSVVLRAPTQAAGLFPLGLAAGVGSLLRDRYGVSPELKWPNDLLVVVRGRPPGKIAGVIVDRISGVSGEPRLVAGIGVNARSERAHFPQELQERVAILAELTPRPVDLWDLEEECAHVAVSIAERLDQPDGPQRILKECRDSLHGRGRVALVDGVPGGVIEEIADDGSLTLSSPSGPVSVRSGDLTVVEAA